MATAKITVHIGGSGAQSLARADYALRATGCLASPFHAGARGATIRSHLIDVAARLARHGRGHLALHLPLGWHREHDWLALFQAGCGPPRCRAA